MKAFLRKLSTCVFITDEMVEEFHEICKEPITLRSLLEALGNNDFSLNNLQQNLSSLERKVNHESRGIITLIRKAVTIQIASKNIKTSVEKLTTLDEARSYNLKGLNQFLCQIPDDTFKEDVLLALPKNPEIYTQKFVNILEEAKDKKVKILKTQIKAVIQFKQKLDGLMADLNEQIHAKNITAICETLEAMQNLVMYQFHYLKKENVLYFIEQNFPNYRVLKIPTHQLKAIQNAAENVSPKLSNVIEGLEIVTAVIGGLKVTNITKFAELQEQVNEKVEKYASSKPKRTQKSEPVNENNETYLPDQKGNQNDVVTILPVSIVYTPKVTSDPTLLSLHSRFLRNFKIAEHLIRASFERMFRSHISEYRSSREAAELQLTELQKACNDYSCSLLMKLPENKESQTYLDLRRRINRLALLSATLSDTTKTAQERFQTFVRQLETDPSITMLDHYKANVADLMQKLAADNLDSLAQEVMRLSDVDDINSLVENKQLSAAKNLLLQKVEGIKKLLTDADKFAYSTPFSTMKVDIAYAAPEKLFAKTNVSLLTYITDVEEFMADLELAAPTSLYFKTKLLKKSLESNDTLSTIRRLIEFGQYAQSYKTVSRFLSAKGAHQWAVPDSESFFAIEKAVAQIESLSAKDKALFLTEQDIEGYESLKFALTCYPLLFDKDDLANIRSKHAAINQEKIEEAGYLISAALNAGEKVEKVYEATENLILDLERVIAEDLRKKIPALSNDESSNSAIAIAGSYSLVKHNHITNMNKRPSLDQSVYDQMTTVIENDKKLKLNLHKHRIAHNLRAQLEGDAATPVQKLQNFNKLLNEKSAVLRKSPDNFIVRFFKAIGRIITGSERKEDLHFQSLLLAQNGTFKRKRADEKEPLKTLKRFTGSV